MLMWKMIPFLCLIMMSSSLKAAEISLQTRDNGFSEIVINGEIVKGDLGKLINVFSEFPIEVKGNLPQVNLTSSGGDVEEAVKIGQLLRAAKVRIIVEDHCCSACFFIYASAVERASSNNSQFLLHRPYFQKESFAGLSAEKAQDKYLFLENTVREYLTSVRVPRTIVDEMMKYSSVDALSLSGSNMEKSIGNIDAAHEEWLLAKCGSLEPQEEKDIWGLFLLVCEDLPNSEKSISSGYCSYLKEKWEKISSCRQDAIKKEQREFISYLRKKDDG